MPRRLRAALTALTILASPSAAETWVSPHHRDHPLTGRILDVATGGFVTPEALTGRLAGADFVLLGERHDNPDHHRLQAQVIDALAAMGRRPAIAFEMIASDRQPEIDAALAGGGATAARIAEAVAWERSGWPDFSLYAPILDAALEAGLAIVAASPPRDQVREAGDAAKDPELDWTRWLEGSRPLPPGYADALAEELVASHCGTERTARTEAMAAVQQVRDARMAARMRDAAADGAVLIAGAGHVRSDRGVPWHLAALVPDASVVAVAFLEVSADAAATDDYPDAFDFLWFTPAIDIDDPCERYREILDGIDAR